MNDMDISGIYYDLHFENTQPNKTLAKTVDTEDIIGYKTIENKYTYKAMGSILRF